MGVVVRLSFSLLEAPPQGRKAAQQKVLLLAGAAKAAQFDKNMKNGLTSSLEIGVVDV